jgi:solute carrier family 35 protein F1/2
VLAYQYTTITSVMLLDCFTIPCVMALSYFLLGHRYTLLHCVGVVLCISGIGVLVFSDFYEGDGCKHTPTGTRACAVFADAVQASEAKNALLGDLICLAASVLYAVSNVFQEKFVKQYNREEYLGMLGLWGFLINGIQA